MPVHQGVQRAVSVTWSSTFRVTWLCISLSKSHRRVPSGTAVTRLPASKPCRISQPQIVYLTAHRRLLCVPYPADHFKEICPAGHGYTYSHSDVQISVRHLGEDDVQSTGGSWEEQSHIYPQPPSSHPSLLLPFVPQQPSYPQTPQVPQYPEYFETPQAPQRPLTPQQPFYPSQEARETPTYPEGERNHLFPCWFRSRENAHSDSCLLSISCALQPKTQLGLHIFTKTKNINNAEQLSDTQRGEGIATRTSTGCFDHRK